MIKDISTTLYGPYPFGSSLFFDNPRDIDLLYLVEDDSFCINEKIIQEKEHKNFDLIYISLPHIRKMLAANSCKDLESYRQLIYLHMLDKRLRPKDFPIKVDIFLKKDLILQAIKKIKQNKKLNWNSQILIDGKYVSKKLYHVLINLFYFKNNDISLNSEQKEIIKKIHDYQMSWEEFNSIYNKLILEVR